MSLRHLILAATTSTSRLVFFSFSSLFCSCFSHLFHCISWIFRGVFSFFFRFLSRYVPFFFFFVFSIMFLFIVFFNSVSNFVRSFLFFFSDFFFPIFSPIFFRIFSGPLFYTRQLVRKSTSMHARGSWYTFMFITCLFCSIHNGTPISSSRAISMLSSIYHSTA